MGLAVFPLLLEKGKKYYPVDEVVTRLEEAQPEPSTVARTRQKRGTRRCLLERAGPLALSACVTVRANETLNVRCWKQVLKTPSLPLLLNRKSGGENRGILLFRSPNPKFLPQRNLT